MLYRKEIKILLIEDFRFHTMYLNNAFFLNEFFKLLHQLFTNKYIYYKHHCEYLFHNMLQ